MLKLIFTYFFLCITFLNTGFCQFSKQIDSISIVCNKAASDSEKVMALGKLADYYYIYKLNRQGDSVLNEQLQAAELSNNSNLMLETFFGNAILNFNSSATSPSTTSESFENKVQFLEKGIKYATEKNYYEFIGLGYSRLAGIYRIKGDYDKALANANFATQSLLNIKSDSVKAVIYIELGRAYLAKGEIVFGCTNYNTAYDIAFKIKSIPLQSEIHHCFSEMYSKLDIKDDAKNELIESLELDRQNNYYEGMVRDYIDLAKITDNRIFIDKALSLADSVHSYKYILAAKKLMLASIEVTEKDCNKALAYLETEPDLKQTYLNNGIASYYSAKAAIFLYANNGQINLVDSALYYYKLAENDYVAYFDQVSIQIIFQEMGLTYELLHDVPNAINYHRKELELTKRMNAISAIAAVSANLSSLYNQQGNYKAAFELSRQAIEYEDSSRSLAKERDIALLGVERENRKHSEEIRRKDQEEKSKRDLQYMGISIAICVVFICMLIIGMFPISKLTIKMLGYFFFISLFEFIVLVIDNTFLNKATHGQPLKLWIIKIALIAALVPLQHFLEHNLIQFLASRKLIEARTRFSFKKWVKKVKKPIPDSDVNLDEGTAVL